jgi:hypothetical protein
MNTPTASAKMKSTESPKALVESATATTSGSPTSSEDSLVHDAPPEYFAPNLQDLLLTDITSHVLKNEVSKELNVSYLHPVDMIPEVGTTVYGSIHGVNHRLLVNLVCRRRRRPGSPKAEHSSYNIIFLVDTGSPVTYICAEAMQALIGPTAVTNPPPNSLHVALQSGKYITECHLSPTESKFADVNVLGMDVMIRAMMKLNGPQKDFSVDGI